MRSSSCAGRQRVSGALERDGCARRAGSIRNESFHLVRFDRAQATRTGARPPGAHRCLDRTQHRRYFFELAERELARSKRHVQDFAVLMLDVDHFKFINDNYGHDAGDEVLRKLGKVCGETLREVDVVGRIGGEEFAALLSRATCAQAMAAAEPSTARHRVHCRVATGTCRVFHRVDRRHQSDTERRRGR